MDSVQLLERLLQKGELDGQECEILMESMLSESVPDSVKGAALALLKSRGVSGLELAAFGKFLRNSSLGIDYSSDGLLDTCGTGGGAPSFNISTAAAIIAASAGAKVGKHGNRAVTSKCGSADVLEYLGISVQNSSEEAVQCLEQLGITFLFAPAYHPTMKNVGHIRKQLGFRTVFNQLGPLANPFGAKRQLLGVYNQELLEPMAIAMKELGCVRGVVVHSYDGLDEISACAPTHSIWVTQAGLESKIIEPKEFGIEGLSRAALEPGTTVEESARILEEAISDFSSDRFKAVLPSASVAIVVAGLVDSFGAAADLAQSVVINGQARTKLEMLKQISNRKSG